MVSGKSASEVIPLLNDLVQLAQNLVFTVTFLVGTKFGGEPWPLIAQSSTQELTGRLAATLHHQQGL